MPEPSRIRERTDAFGNTVIYFDHVFPHSQMMVSSESQLDNRQIPLNESIFSNIRYGELNGYMKAIRQDTLNARQFLFPSPHIPHTSAVKSIVNDFFQPDSQLIDAIRSLNTYIFQTFSFVPGTTDIYTPLEEILRNKSGVCQDFAHLLIACCRLAGIPAKYVSGYLETIPPPGEQKLQGVDASHAWVSVFIPEIGWLEFDPTNNQQPNQQYIRIAYGRDFSDVTPLKGVVYSGTAHQMQVSVDVERIG